MNPNSKVPASAGSNAVHAPHERYLRAGTAIFSLRPLIHLPELISVARLTAVEAY